MRIAYTREDGLRAFLDLSETPVVIGRSPEADIVLADNRVSRLHCGIRMDGKTAIVKDLGSRNGTYLNTERLAAPAIIRLGDHIRVGETVFVIEEMLAKGSQTLLHEIEEDMDHGKGYHTILREIVKPRKDKKE